MPETKELYPGTIDPPPDGIYPGVDEKEYRQWKAWNISLLKNCRRTLERVRAECTDPTPIGAETALKGHLFHKALFEPDAITDVYAIQPATYPVVQKLEGVVGTVKKEGMTYIFGSGRGANREEYEIEPIWDDEAGEYVAWTDATRDLEIVESKWNANATYCKAWAATQGDKVAIKASALETAMNRSLRLWDLPDARRLMDGAEYEVSIVWTDPQTGLRCKGRLDLWNEGFNAAIADGKSSANPADYEQFTRTMRRYGYCEQAAFYRDGVNILLALVGKEVPKMGRFTFLVSEDQTPYTPAIYTLLDTGCEGSGPYFIHGRTNYHRWLQQVRHAINNDFWPGHNPGPGGVTEEVELAPVDFWPLDGMELM